MCRTTVDKWSSLTFHCMDIGFDFCKRVVVQEHKNNLTINIVVSLLHMVQHVEVAMFGNYAYSGCVNHCHH